MESVKERINDTISKAVNSTKGIQMYVGNDIKSIEKDLKSDNSKLLNGDIIAIQTKKKDKSLITQLYCVVDKSLILLKEEELNIKVDENGYITED